MPLLLFLLSLLLVAPAEAADAILKVRSNVQGAEVMLDGKVLGQAPLTTYVAPGVHQLRVTADRHDPFVRRIEVGDGKTLEVSATLAPGRGSAEWVGPAGARLYVDGQPRGLLPTRLPDLAVGTHTWRVEAPKYEPAEGSVEFVEGKNYYFDVRLESSEGVFVVQSTPPGAEVRLDGALVGSSPLRLTGIPRGLHGVEVRHPDRAVVYRSVDTTDGGRGEVVVTLAKEGADLKVATGAEDAKVYINGVLVGQGGQVRAGPIARGNVTVRVESAEGAASESLALPGSGTVALRVDGARLARQRPLTERWGFWAAVGGTAAAGAGVATALTVSSQPAPLPEGDVVVVLP